MLSFCGLLHTTATNVESRALHGQHGDGRQCLQGSTYGAFARSGLLGLPWGGPEVVLVVIIIGYCSCAPGISGDLRGELVGSFKGSAER